MLLCPSGSVTDGGSPHGKVKVEPTRPLGFRLHSARNVQQCPPVEPFLLNDFQMREIMQNGYRSLALQTAISGAIMYVVMFVMIDRLGSFYNNLNMFYMTLMMVAPMVALMVLAMPGMFPSRAGNIALVAGSVVLFLGSFALIRTQTTIGDTAFLRSMIPHHSGAILMCEQASLSDPEIVRLCRSIIESQREEITQMRAMLERL
jgi:hypothetical protein